VSLGLFGRLRHPPTTVRWRLTLLYGGLFLICGAALLAVTYTLAANGTVVKGPGEALTNAPPLPNLAFKARARQSLLSLPPGQVPPGILQAFRSSAGRAVVRFVGAKQRTSDLRQLEIESGIALAIMTIISGLLGWVVAGRVLRPLRTITATTQRLSEANLHERLALEGPRDELRTLADTIDGLLERLERAFVAQRRFVTNASHELRTPLTASRALLEMAISDPHATVASLSEACRGALEEGDQQEQLIDALLALAQGERGLNRRQVVDLASIAREVERAYEPEASERGITIESEVEAAETKGDRRLLVRLVSNLIQNAVRHNVPGGYVRVRVAHREGGAELTVINSGPRVPAAQIPRLLEPFQRIAPDRVGHPDGFGLGLSIVAAVAAAHDAELEIEPGPDGGLRVVVRFPPVAPAPPQSNSDVTDHTQDDGAVGTPGSVQDELQLGLR
jgi:signal transduction histidine kinase